MIACAGARRTASSVSISQTRELQYAAAINEDIVSYLEETCAAGQSRESIARFIVQNVGDTWLDYGTALWYAEGFASFTRQN